MITHCDTIVQNNFLRQASQEYDVITKSYFGVAPTPAATSSASSRRLLEALSARVGATQSRFKDHGLPQAEINSTCSNFLAHHRNSFDQS